MSGLEALLPAGFEPWIALALVLISALTSFLTAAVGIGGGAVLLACMAVLMPPSALIPVHGMVQIGSNAGRTLIMLGHVEHRILLPFALGSALGVALGGLVVVQLPPAALQIGLAGFILWSTWGRVPSAIGRLAVSGAGLVSSFLTMFFGATGAFVASMLKSMRLGRMEHVASQAACMSLQHALKVLTFGLLGFAYGPWVPLIALMIASGFLGTVLGKRVLMRTADDRFHTLLSAVLTL
ncbi:MAG TPA: sulfite exporter TauE/SafE family protein, partial [Geminicoccaceae bacterium]